MNFIILRIFIFSFAIISSSIGVTRTLLCNEVLTSDFLQGSLAKDESNAEIRPGLRKNPTRISAKALSAEAAHKMLVVPEFQFIRAEAEKRGIRVWLFGGTASSYLHYVKWNLVREKGLNQLQADRFDFDYTNIFRSTQDLDIVVDGSAEQASEFQKTIAEKYPHFLGSKAAKWEVRTLRTRMGKPGELGYKEALLGDEDFNNQNSDSNSLGMVEVTHSKEPVVRDLRHWDSIDSPFLQDALNDRISFFRSREHFTTSRAKAGENPEILSVTRLLVKAFQYQLNFSEAEFKEMKEIVAQFDPQHLSVVARRRFDDTAKKLIIHANNIEYAMNMLDKLGLRKKLIEMGNKEELNSVSWWLNKEPLRSKPVGQFSGLTARELGIDVVAHETNSLLAYESIIRAHSGEPNVLVSRENTIGEKAFFGNGFYTRQGRKGAALSGLTIRFTVDPSAREGTAEEGGDFIRKENYILFHNKKALKVIPESLNFSLSDLVKMAESNEFEVDHSDLALVEKFKRKLNVAKITDEFEKLLASGSEKDHQHLIDMLYSFQTPNVEIFISKEVFSAVAKNIFLRVSATSHSSNDKEILKYIKTLGPIIKLIDSMGVFKSEHFFDYLTELIQSPTINFSVREQALFELLQSNENFEQYLTQRSESAPTEFKTFIKKIMPEVYEWHKSSNPRKRKFAAELNCVWSNAVESGDRQRLKALIASNLFDINHKNLSQVSMLQLAEYYKQVFLITWLLHNPDFDFNSKNKSGFTEVEQLRLSGKASIADLIQELRPEVQARKFVVKERNLELKTTQYPEGTPIVDFVRIEPGSFMMGPEQNKVFTTIPKSFEFMSVDTTKETYRRVADLAKEYQLLDSTFNSSPFSTDGESKPVDYVSFDRIEEWLKGLNELSALDKGNVQQILGDLFPGHQRGQKYDLPTAAQWEFVSRLGGVAESDYSHGKGEEDLEKYAVFQKPNDLHYRVHNVGSKKPVFYNGKPIYDLHGNVHKWVKDIRRSEFGGVKKIDRLIRGGNFDLRARNVRSSSGYHEQPAYARSMLSFRLIRAAE